MTDKQAPQGGKPANDLPVGVKGSVKPGAGGSTATGGGAKPDAGGPIGTPVGAKGVAKPGADTAAAAAPKVNK